MEFGKIPNSDNAYNFVCYKILTNFKVYKLPFQQSYTFRDLHSAETCEANLETYNLQKQICLLCPCLCIIRCCTYKGSFNFRHTIKTEFERCGEIIYKIVFIRKIYRNPSIKDATFDNVLLSNILQLSSQPKGTVELQNIFNLIKTVLDESPLISLKYFNSNNCSPRIYVYSTGGYLYCSNNFSFIYNNQSFGKSYCRYIETNYYNEVAFFINLLHGNNFKSDLSINNISRFIFEIVSKSDNDWIYIFSNLEGFYKNYHENNLLRIEADNFLYKVNRCKALAKLNYCF